MPNTANTEDRYRPETDQGLMDESSSGSIDSSRLELRDLRAVFRKFEESKTSIVARVLEIRRTSGNNAHAKAQAELELKDALEQLAESNKQLKIAGDKASSLEAELSTAKRLLEEIDETLA